MEGVDLLDLVVVDFFDNLLSGNRVGNVVLHVLCIMIGLTAAARNLPIS